MAIPSLVKIRTALAASACVGAFGLTAPVHAATIDLGFIVDQSGSIAASEFDIIRNGLASAINLIPFGGTDTYRVSVVKFSSVAQTVVDRILVTDAASRSSAATLVAAMTQGGGSTNYELGFDQMRSVLTASGALATAYVNFATDGEPNLGDTAAGRTNLIAAGVDNISVEGIGVSAAGATFLQTNVCYPGPCDTTFPFNFPAQGFYLGVANATEYASAIRTKIAVVTGTIPEPGTVVLLGLALLGVGVAAGRNFQATGG